MLMPYDAIFFPFSLNHFNSSPSMMPGACFVKVGCLDQAASIKVAAEICKF